MNKERKSLLLNQTIKAAPLSRNLQAEERKVKGNVKTRNQR
jgi:hypothetical protein